MTTTASPVHSVPSCSTRAYTRLHPGCTLFEIRTNSRSRNASRIVIHGEANAVTSTSTSPSDRRVPGSSVDQSRPLIVTFSPTAPGDDRMPLELQLIDQLERIERQRAIRSAVVHEIPLPIARHSLRRDARFFDRQLGNAAVRAIQRHDPRAHSTSAVTRCTGMPPFFVRNCSSKSSSICCSSFLSAVSSASIHPGRFRRATLPSCA